MRTFSIIILNQAGIRLLALALLMGCLAGPAKALGYQYTVQDLTALLGPYSGVSGLNDLGEFSGSYREGLLGQVPDQAYRFTQQHGLELLGSLGGSRATGSAINNFGQVAGEIHVPVGDGTVNRHGFLYTPGVGMVDIGSLGGVETEVFGMNNLGQVVGFSETGGPNEEAFAFRYTPGIGMERLGGITPDVGSHAYGINDHGTVVGAAGVFVPEADQVQNHAFRHSDAEGMVDLGALWNKGNSHAWAINNNGMIVGDSTVFGGAIEAVIWVDDQIQSIGSLGGQFGTRARDVNDAGVVLGQGHTLDGFTRSFVWTEEGGIQELNTLIDPESGWTIISAGEINNSGQIIGYGNYQGETRYFLMNPVPEPSTWALLGLGGLLFMIFHRKRKL